MKIRKIYEKWLNDVCGTEFIKVITGVRRSGKSMLLKLVNQKLIEKGVSEKQVVYINFESVRFENFKTRNTLREYIETLNFSETQKVYFLFDEIQEVEEWQIYINSLRVDYNCEIYITGSNAKLLSGELATYLSGRYIELKMFPLSFAEYLDFKNFDQTTKNVDIEFFNFLQWGGFPMLPLLENEDLKRSVLDGIGDSIIFKDVALRGDVRDKESLLKVVNYLLDTTGNLISTKKIADTLTSGGFKTSTMTVDKYLNLLTDALIFYKAERYDIRGKERLKSLAKYYVVDTGLKNQRLGKTYRDNIGSQLENVVYIELKRRGYHVSVGKFKEREIDFVAIKSGIIKYYQVAYQMPTDSTREEENLLMIPDNYEKFIITANRMDVGNVGGIKVVHIVDFLLGNHN